MNKYTAEIIDRFEVEPEAALRILAAMEIDLSECTQKQFNDEALRVYESITAEEWAAPQEN